MCTHNTGLYGELTKIILQISSDIFFFIEFTFYVKFLNFRTPENFAVIYLKFKQRGQILGYVVKKIQTVKTLIRLLLKEQSDLGLHCLPRPVCPKPYTGAAWFS